MAFKCREFHGSFTTDHYADEFCAKIYLIALRVRQKTNMICLWHSGRMHANHFADSLHFTVMGYVIAFTFERQERIEVVVPIQTHAVMTKNRNEVKMNCRRCWGEVKIFTWSSHCDSTSFLSTAFSQFMLISVRMRFFFLRISCIMLNVHILYSHRTYSYSTE